MLYTYMYDDVMCDMCTCVNNIHKKNLNLQKKKHNKVEEECGIRNYEVIYEFLRYVVWI